LGLIDGITFPLIFEVYTTTITSRRYLPLKEKKQRRWCEKSTLGDSRELVLADSPTEKVKVSFWMFEELKLNFVVAIRTNQYGCLRTNGSVQSMAEI